MLVQAAPGALLYCGRAGDHHFHLTQARPARHHHDERLKGGRGLLTPHYTGIGVIGVGETNLYSVDPEVAQVAVVPVGDGYSHPAGTPDLGRGPG